MPTANLIATFPQPYNGQVSFKISRGIIKVTGSITGLPPNSFLGAHIHENGDLGNRCLNAGGHYNPFGMSHGGPKGTPRHPGDFGNLQTDENGVAKVDLTICCSRLTNNFMFLGLAMVIHEGTDDLGRGGDAGSLATGNSGGRITCAVVGLARSSR
ncbi:unnamed protein product [Echinostoma caproni]|uniref:Sod_Cu domain-containing protein n=1 Tax=Echinostoma caproni TaxID=27848 RepID=A0A183B4Z1_9TREM|nr:unnamed protein product [Echinostoma caproni]